MTIVGELRRLGGLGRFWYNGILSGAHSGHVNLLPCATEILAGPSLLNTIFTTLNDKEYEYLWLTM